MKLERILLIGALLAVPIAFALGTRHRGAAHSDASHSMQAPGSALWTCPMHPAIQLPDAVPCPVCGMDLVPSDGAVSDELTLSPQQVALAQVESAPVERRSAVHEVRLVGTVAVDAASRTVVAARVSGRLERVFVDFPGVRVQRGDHLVELYSPALLAAQEELLVAAALQAKRSNGREGPTPRENLTTAYELAREKLLLFGLRPEQIDAVEQAGKASDRVVLHSQVSGTVQSLMAEQGQYVKEGSPLMEISDLGHVWVELEAFEQDLPWLRYGQPTTLQAEALPGVTLSGTVSFIEPEVDRVTRTTTVRVSLENRDQRLKPGMFARAQVHAELGVDGAALPADLAGKWISPMHPEVIHDAPGSCDICGMDLVSAEEFHLATGHTHGAGTKPLVVPISAVLPTGRRSVVYLERSTKDGFAYEAREVVLGPRADDVFVVEEGLEEGDHVVVRGAFRIDSAMQIRGIPSSVDRMATSGSPAGDRAQAAALRESLASFWQGVLDLAQALGDERAKDALILARELPDQLAAARPGSLPPSARADYDLLMPELIARTRALGDSPDADGLIQRLAPFFEAALPLADAFGVPAAAGAREVHCPMALDGAGASWIQREGPVHNPYFGSAMLRCGDALRALGVR